MTVKPTKSSAASNVSALPTTKAASRAAAAATASSPAAVPVVTAKAPIRKKEFVDRAAALSGVRKSEARAGIEATLALLAELLGEGQEVIVPPLGRLKVTREKQGKNGRQQMVRINLPKVEETASQPLADDEE